MKRRDYLKTIGGTVAGLAVGLAAGYYTYPAFNPPPPIPKPPEKIEVVGATPGERALDAAKKLIEREKIPAGTEINVLAYGGVVGSFEVTKAQWEAATKTKITYTPAGGGDELYEKLSLEATARTGAYDVMVAESWMIGDFVGAGLLQPLDEWAATYDPRVRGKPDGYIYPLDWMCYYRGHLYNLLVDGDVLCSMWRKDLLEDPKEQEGFEKQYGYPLHIPDTIDQYHDVLEWFHRPPDLYGCGEFRAINWWAWPSYMWRFACKKWPNMYWFDDEMNALIDTPEGLKAAEQYQIVSKWMHPDNLIWAGAENYGAYRAGKIFGAVCYPSNPKDSALPISPVKDKIVCGLVPGEIVDSPIGRILHRRSVAPTPAGLSVNAYGKHPELAYLYIQWVIDPTNLVSELATEGSWWDPSRYNQVGPAYDRGMVHPETELLVMEKCAEQAIPNIMLKGAAEYIDKLNKELHRLAAFEVTPEQFCKTVQSDWDSITERVGKDYQKKEWEMCKAFYPSD